ncbi:MAG: OmpA family protein [Candidatus Binatia bacterium]|jgi:OOP family OmpA-OmpF porin|nr:OmpA family protein [Candidatus Binatia bacterium]
MQLALRRAEAVREEILKLGISPDRIQVANRGESSPLIDEQTDWAHAVNQRVEFKVSNQ